MKYDLYFAISKALAINILIINAMNLAEWLVGGKDEKYLLKKFSSLRSGTIL